MKTTKNIARLAVTAGLTAALSFGGVMVPVTMAFATEGATGSITINKVAEDNRDNTFKAYQIFKAKVVDEGSKGKVASDIEWSSTTIGSKVIVAIRGSAKYKEIVGADGTAALADSATAPVVAEWLAKNVTGTSASSATSSEGTRVAPGDVLYAIAAAITDETPAGNSFKVGDSWTRPDTYGDGYYLFVSDGLTDATKPNTGTSPIFAIVGGKAVTVTEKTSIPTVTKKVKDDRSSSGWADKADSQMGQDVQYQLTGTVADNVATFNTYYYEFHDELSAGLTAKANSVVVKIGDTTLSRNATPGATTGYDVSIDANNTLTVTFTDLKAAAKQANATLDGRSNVVVTYTAKLDPMKAANVTVGGLGNDNTVKLIYSNNPMSDGKGESVPDTVRDYTYALELIKQDADSDTKINGVKFTIQATDPDDTSSKDKYVNDEGILVENPYEFETANGGKINVKGLDAGTYKVHEVEGSNPGYNTLDDFTFTIKAEGLSKDEGVALDENTAVNTLKVTVQKNDSATMVTPSVDSGTVTLTVKNKKGSNLPLTGLNGVTFTWIAGGAVLCIGVAHLIRSRKRDEGSEE